MATLISQLPLHILSFIPLCMMVVYLVIVIFRTCRPYAKMVSSHSPSPYPILGCLTSYYKNRSRLQDCYTELLAESATKTIVLHRLGARKTIVTANPANVQYMLKTNFNNFPKGKPFTDLLGDFLGCGIFNVDGELWRAQRKLASQEFTAKTLRGDFTIALREEVGNGLLPLLGSLAATGKAVDLQELLRRLAFNMVCEVSLGIDPFFLDPSLPAPPLARAFDVASEISARRGTAPLTMIWRVQRWLGIGSERRLKEAVGEVHDCVDEIISRKKKMVEGEGGNLGKGLLSRLILAGHEDKLIRDMVISFILAGRDTTSAAMTWLFWSLSCHPDIEQDVTKEAKQVMETMPLGYDSLQELRLMEACLCESMRLYPPIPWDSKHAVMDDLLPDNTIVRAGDRVTYFPYGMGRMEALWGKDWWEFKPDRWFLEPSRTGALKKICPYKFPIFHAGPRVCLGKEMAFVQMKYVVASILAQFEIRPVSLDRPVFLPLLTAHMAGGFKVLVRQRNRDPGKTPSHSPQ